MCSLKSDLSSFSKGNHNLVDTHLHESISAHLPKNLHESYTESLEMDFSSLPNKKCNLLDSQFHKMSGSSPNKKNNSTDTLSPEDDCTSSPENHYGSYSLSPASDFSFQEEMLTPESKCYPSPHKKQKISNNGLSDDDCSSLPCVKHRLISDGLIKSVSPSPTESISSQSDSDCFPSHLRRGNNELPLNTLLKASIDCEKMLRQIIRTAYQFTRHSHREKLSLKDLEKAFKIHNVDIGSDDFDCLVDKIDRDSVEDENESQPFTCTGKWLRMPSDTSLNE